MSQPRDDRQDDLFRPPLEEIINFRHLAGAAGGEIDWDFLARRPLLPTRLVAGLFILKHMHNLSDAEGGQSAERRLGTAVSSRRGVESAANYFRARAGAARGSRSE